jgi:hypothetical protein
MVATNSGAVDARTWEELSELHHQMLDPMAQMIDEGRACFAAGADGSEPVFLSTALLLLQLPDSPEEH